MELSKKSILSGEELAWQRLASEEPQKLCHRASITFCTKEQAYTIKCLGQEFKINPTLRNITGVTEQSQLLLTNLSYFLRLAMLWYILEAKDIGLSGRLVNPINIKGGDMFFKGSHFLPLKSLCNRYSHDLEGFYKKSFELGGLKTTGGDAACILHPFPRVPVTIILWKADEEFDASASLLFDSTCQIHLPLDVIWSTAMFTILALLK